jgi:hypothetical protein
MCPCARHKSMWSTCTNPVVLNTDTWWRSVVSVTPRPLYSQLNCPSGTCWRGARWTSEQVCRFWRNTSLFKVGNRTAIPQMLGAVIRMKKNAYEIPSTNVHSWFTEISVWISDTTCNRSKETLVWRKIICVCIKKGVLWWMWWLNNEVAIKLSPSHFTWSQPSSSYRRSRFWRLIRPQSRFSPVFFYEWRVKV